MILFPSSSSNPGVIECDGEWLSTNPIILNCDRNPNPIIQGMSPIICHTSPGGGESRLSHAPICLCWTDITIPDATLKYSWDQEDRPTDNK